MNDDQEKVSTEPQRLALEEMSRDLVDKLNKMVAEQEERAAQFAAQQHSLSAKPSVPTSISQPTYRYSTPPPPPTYTRLQMKPIFLLYHLLLRTRKSNQP